MTVGHLDNLRFQHTLSKNTNTGDVLGEGSIHNIGDEIKYGQRLKTGRVPK